MEVCKYHHSSENQEHGDEQQAYSNRAHGSDELLLILRLSQHDFLSLQQSNLDVNLMELFVHEKFSMFFHNRIPLCL